jgi:hypothetical protein
VESVRGGIEKWEGRERTEDGGRKEELKMMKGLEFGRDDRALAQLIPILGDFINDLPAKIQEINNPIVAQTV